VEATAPDAAAKPADDQPVEAKPSAAAPAEDPPSEPEAPEAKAPEARPPEVAALPGLGRLRAIGEGSAPAGSPRPRAKVPSPAAASLIARVRATATSAPPPASASPPVAAGLGPRRVLPATAAPTEPAATPMPLQAPTVIDIRNLSLTFMTNDGPVEALQSIDLAVGRGEFVSLIGPSGCGKTTLLRVIADLERPSAGSLTVNGVSPEEARQRRAYGYIFQAPALYPWRTIARNVALPLEIMGLPKAERDRRVAANLALVNLTGFERKYPWQLSGGMQQRVSIARALSVEPDLLLMDEPFGALDEIVRDHLNEQLLQLWAKTDKTVIFVTHSIPEAVFLSTRIVVMSPRPGRVYDVIPSTLPRERTLDIRETPEFLQIAHRVRMGLRAGHSYED
jgi:NitT/TauT family transport system ATP-binding protein